MSSYSRAVLVEQERGRGEEQGNETDEGTRPADFELYKMDEFVIKGKEWTLPTFVNICTVNNGKVAATADREEPLAANAEAQYTLSVKY